MQELGQLVQLIQFFKTLLEVVLDGFDIMVCGGLNGFDPLCRLQVKVLNQVVEKRIGCFAEA